MIRMPIRLVPGHLPIIVALIGIGCTLDYVVKNEVPVGKIEGVVTLDDTHKPISGVEITLVSNRTDQASPLTRNVVSGSDGRFTLANVPTGDYDLSASTHAHMVESSHIQVYEGIVTPASLEMKRSQPDFKIIAHQRVYGSSERAHIAVTGYVNSDRPANHDKFHLRLYRARLSEVLQDKDRALSLEQVGRDYDQVPALPKNLLHPPNGQVPQTLIASEMPIKGEDREGFYYQKVDFGKLKPGLYLADLKHDKMTDCTWLLVTDTALVVKRSRRQMMAFVVDMVSGKPIRDSVVRTYRNGAVIAQARTDSHGLAELKTADVANKDAKEDDANSTQITTVAIRGEDDAVVDRNAFRTEDNDRYKVHVYTDRPIYRPGQRISFKGIVRRSNAPQLEPAMQTLDKPEKDHGLRYSVPVGVPVEVELRDKTGERILQRTLRTDRYGGFSGTVDLLREAPSGVYTLLTRIDGDEHTHDIVIASYRKPEFAVTVTPDKPRYLRGETVTMTVQSQYFFGAPVAGAKVQVSVYSSPDWAAEYADKDTEDASDSEDSEPSFAHYRGESYYGGYVTDKKLTLDDNGRAVIQFVAGADDKKTEGTNSKDTDSNAIDQDVVIPEMVYTAHATVTEGQDREADADGTARVVAGDYRLRVSPEGYAVTPGRPTLVTLAALDYDGKPVATAPIALETGYESWKDDEYKYRKQGIQRRVTGADGRVIIPVTPSRTGTVRLIARSTDRHGHLIQSRATLWSTSDAGGDLDTTYDDLALMTDKRRYNPGDSARVLINTERLGETILLTVEGDHVYRSQTFEATQHSTIAHVPILKDYGPNVFLSACYVRTKHFAQSSTPLHVALPSGELKVTIRADREVTTQAVSNNVIGTPKHTALYHPGDLVTYKIQTTDSQGRPRQCDFSLGVVDEAIYSLREDDPHALRNAFYPQRENGVSTLYSFAAKYLGDADKAEPQIVARKRFHDTAYWQPALQTDANGRATVSFVLPDNLTTWRATVTADTLDTRVGRAIDKIVVSKDFLVRLQTPRTLTQHDQAKLVGLVHNETGSVQTATVRLIAKNLTINGPATQQINLAPGQIATVEWPVTADAFGTADLTMKAWTVHTNGVQYTDGIETTLPIRAHGREALTTFAGELTASNPETEVVRLDPKTVPGSGALTIRITPSIASALTGGVDYLIGYPYGCVEQTMSRLLPDILVQRALAQKGIFGVKDPRELTHMTQEGLERLYRFQHQSGAWGWWQHDADDPWMTAYVLYGLAAARRQGFPVSAKVLAHARKAAIEMAGKISTDERPFLLYALALNGETSTLQAKLHSMALKGLQPEALCYLVLTERLLKQDTGQVMQQILRKSISQGDLTHWESNDPHYKGDSITATAMALRVLMATDPHNSRIASILRWLMSRRNDNYWTDTRDTTWVLASLCDYLSSQSGHSAGGQVIVRLNGQEIHAYALTENNLQEKELILRVPSTSLRPGKNDVTLTRIGGSSAIFYTVQLRQSVEADELPAISVKGLSVKREYLKVVSHREKGDTWTLGTESTGCQFVSGDHVRVRLKITAAQDMDYVLIEDPFPAGCEVSERGDADDVTAWGYWWSSVDIRDDRIAYFARNLSKGEHIIEYNLRAQTPGRYRVLPTLVQAMYTPDQHAETAVTRIEIK